MQQNYNDEELALIEYIQDKKRKGLELTAEDRIRDL